ncbi:MULTISPECIES: class II aldolase/adducin family protein [unclassified Pseudofrankia]|uniref:class II aldolase/adducin family protein n=1 Tax=unclassified Pseudofrankia TaxID=2994372 RepID=UPI0008DA0D2F|nr:MULTISPECIES: class II aldolase/adducin family protein [unclassified Pseudofrankia]MDT3442167.1 class II aldolase/adducin family protein [Pseudofrankia sp. BMG5.37]OHV43613.1 ribulose phosphate epimerase [Pseudofrankia sp. BMG5.36]
MTTNPVEEAVQASQALAAAGLNDLVWGHAAIREPDGRGGVWMKAAGWGFEEIDADRVLLVSPDGEVLSGAGKRHIEYPIHTEIMRRRPDVSCSVHTHAPALSAFACLDTPLLPISHDGVLFCDPPIPRFTQTGALIATAELGAALAETLGDARACLMPNHGAVTVGPDATTAVMYAVLLERACRTQLMALAAGGPKIWSDPAEAALKREQIWNPGGLQAGWRYLLRPAERALR